MSPIWPAAGFGFAAMLIFGPQMALGIFLGSWLLWSADHFASEMWWPRVLMATGSSSGALLGYFYTLRKIGPNVRFQTVFEVWKFVFAAVLICVVASIVGVCATTIILPHSTSEFFRDVGTWFVGDFVGILVLAPFLLIVHRLITEPALWKQMPSYWEFALLIFLNLLISLLVYQVPFKVIHFPLRFLVGPLLFWAAYRFTHFGVVFTIGWIAIVSSWSRVNGLYPMFDEIPGSITLGHLQNQIFLGVASACGLILATVFDVQQRLTRELQRSNVELNQFASVASHDLREPLRLISCYLQLIERKLVGPQDADISKFLKHARTGTERMHGLINGLLSYAQVGPGTNGERVSCNLNRILVEVFRCVGRTGSEVGFSISHPELPVLKADGTQMLQLWQNLISNAIKFHKPGIRSEITIGIRPRMQDWLFWVADNGIGIDSRYHESIFQIFHRAHCREEFPGQGIGLATCKRVIENHGGRLWVQSRPKRGTTFYFTIPKDAGDRWNPLKAKRRIFTAPPTACAWGAV